MHTYTHASSGVSVIQPLRGANRWYVPRRPCTGCSTRRYVHSYCPALPCHERGTEMGSAGITGRYAHLYYLALPRHEHRMKTCSALVAGTQNDVVTDFFLCSAKERPFSFVKKTRKGAMRAHSKIHLFTCSHPAARCKRNWTTPVRGFQERVGINAKKLT